VSAIFSSEPPTSLARASNSALSLLAVCLRPKRVASAASWRLPSAGGVWFCDLIFSRSPSATGVLGLPGGWRRECPNQYISYSVPRVRRRSRNTCATGASFTPDLARVHPNSRTIFAQIWAGVWAKTSTEEWGQSGVIQAHKHHQSTFEAVKGVEHPCLGDWSGQRREYQQVAPQH
jgi:hypothetical protein